MYLQPGTFSIPLVVVSIKRIGNQLLVVYSIQLIENLWKEANAEARVPVVNVEDQELEAGLWVGQSAANVKELFQTATYMEPVTIFVEDFDLFAGVRGKFIHTKQQDHESFINQLLVELDGFEKQDGVVLMANTGNHKQIDEALRRPGRMDRIFHLQSPTEMESERFYTMLQKKPWTENSLIWWISVRFRRRHLYYDRQN